MGLKERKEALEREQAALKQLEADHLWAGKELEKYDPDQRRMLLAYLTEWIKSQTGHGRHCTCGECD